jgi:ribosomal protein S18 acetylase RimI-like enzyme
MGDPGASIGLTTRPIRYDDGRPHPDDVAAITRLVLACDAAVMDVVDRTASDILGMLLFPAMDRESSFVVLDGEETVGMLWLEKDQFEKVTFLAACSLPWPGSREIRELCLDRGVEAARRHGREAGDPAWKVRAGSYVTDTHYLDLLAERGFAPVRRWYRMRIESSSPLVPAEMPPLPEGVAIVTGDDEAFRRTVHAVDREAFAEHFGFADYPFDDWWEHWSSQPSFDIADWWLLTVDGVPAGVCMLEETRAENAEGYVGVLGVLKPYRGRGLAQLLLRRAFVHYRDLGRTATLLTVDASNETGAVALYERVGMSAVLVTETRELTGA